jgi:hypothetical protein
VSAAVEFILLGAARYGLDAKQLALALARQTDLSQASIVALAAEVKVSERPLCRRSWRR